MSMTSNAERPVLIPTGQLRARYGNPPVSDTWVDRRLASDPNFPRPVYIGNRRYWKISELENFERGLARSPEQAA